MILKTLSVILVALLVSLLAGIFGWYRQILMVFAVYLMAATVILYIQQNSEAKVRYLALLVSPWLLIYGGLALFEGLNYLTLIVITPVLATLLAGILDKISKPIVKRFATLLAALASGVALYIANVNYMETALNRYNDEFSVGASDKSMGLLGSTTQKPIVLYHLWSVSCKTCLEEFDEWQRIEKCAISSNILTVEHIHLSFDEINTEEVKKLLADVIDSSIVDKSSYISVKDSQSLLDSTELRGIPAFILVAFGKVKASGHLSFNPFSTRRITSILESQRITLPHKLYECLTNV